MTRLLQSFGYAFEGIVEATRVQPNLALHWAIAGVVLVAALALHVALLPFVFIVALIALVVSLELVNTAIEAQVDLATTALHPLAKRAKDAAAAAVLVASAGAALCGLAIFAGAAFAGDRAPSRPGVDPQTVVAAIALPLVVAVLARARLGGLRTSPVGLALTLLLGAGSVWICLLAHAVRVL